VFVVSGQTGTEHLAKRRAVRFNGSEVTRTPLLVPSFSSKGFPEVKKILRYAEEVIESPMLISAYDLSHKLIEGPFDFAPLLFLDSGGYEASKEAELSDFGEHEHHALGWSEQQYLQEVNKWSSLTETIVVSYDHPNERLKLAEQVKRANKLLPKKPGRIREFLMKPERTDQRFLKIKSVIENIHQMAEFQVIGVTEKEIGASVLERMGNIAQIRLELNRAGLELPIHVFGSLDTITTPLYFVAGADIFDGLTWLRFAFKDGQTLYKQNYGALHLELNTKTHLIDGRCWNSNYYYLKNMELEMRRFLTKHDFKEFTHHAEFIRHAHTSMMEEIGAKYGRQRGRPV
jgi:hypothetical protein